MFYDAFLCALLSYCHIILHACICLTFRILLLTYCCVKSEYMATDDLQSCFIHELALLYANLSASICKLREAIADCEYSNKSLI